MVTKLLKTCICIFAYEHIYLIVIKHCWTIKYVHVHQTTTVYIWWEFALRRNVWESHDFALRRNICLIFDICV